MDEEECFELEIYSSEQDFRHSFKIDLGQTAKQIFWELTNAIKTSGDRDTIITLYDIDHTVLAHNTVFTSDVIQEPIGSIEIDLLFFQEVYVIPLKFYRLNFNTEEEVLNYIAEHDNQYTSYEKHTYSGINLTIEKIEVKQ